MLDIALRSTSPVWRMTPIDFPDAGPLHEDTTADVCVIGAGIAGLTTAYLLGRAGKNVVVLEAGELGGGETARTSAHLSSALDDGFHELERLHGSEGARLAA
jgi:glycine/D-amino acid oxidase-like deaminating enzyme